ACVLSAHCVFKPPVPTEIYTLSLHDALPISRPHSYRVYGRFRRSTVTGTPYGEIFAASWWPNCHRMLDRHLERIVRTFHSGESNRRDGWTLLRSIQGTPLNSHRVMQPWFIEINDWTDDIDFPADYERHPATRGTTK